MSESRRDAHGEMTTGGRWFTNVDDLPSGHIAPPGLKQFHWDDGLRDPLTQASHSGGEPVHSGLEPSSSPSNSVLEETSFAQGAKVGGALAKSVLIRSRLSALL